MKEWIAKIELVEKHDASIRVNVSTRDRYGKCTTASALYPRHSTVAALLEKTGKAFVLMRASRNRTLHFVREVAPQSW